MSFLLNHPALNGRVVKQTHLWVCPARDIIKEAIPQLHGDGKASQHVHAKREALCVEVFQRGLEAGELCLGRAEVVLKTSELEALFVIDATIRLDAVCSISLIDRGVCQLVFELGLEWLIEECLCLVGSVL